MILSTVLNIDSQLAINGIVLIISAAGFIVMYNKTVKNRINKGDMEELRRYVDQQDRSLHNRVNGLESHMEGDIKELRQTTNEILKILINQRHDRA